MAAGNRVRCYFVLCGLAAGALLLAAHFVSSSSWTILAVVPPPTLSLDTDRENTPVRAKDTPVHAKDTPVHAKDTPVRAKDAPPVQRTKDTPVRTKNTPVLAKNREVDPDSIPPVAQAKVSKEARACPCPRDLEMKVKDEEVVAMEMETNETAVVTYFQQNKLNAQKGLGRRRESLDPEFEAPLFRYPPLTHAVCLPDYTRSKVSLLTPADPLSVGSPVQFRVDLYNGCGQPRSAGGDEIRAWLKSQDGRSSVAAKVQDLGNGSYVGESVLLWSGVTLVRVSLTYAREYLRSCVEMYHTLHSMRYTTELMRSGNVTEMVPCLPSAPIPGYAKACNFTAANGGHPWYCGHPTRQGLSCRHRSVYANLPFHPAPVPPALKQYVKNLNKCCNGKNPNLRLIENNIQLNTSLEMAPPPPRPLPPCSSRPAKESWSSPSPKGWIRHGQWVSSTCRLPQLTKDRAQRCLTNRTVLLLGDSNQRYLWRAIAALVNCTSRKVTAWNGHHVCRNDHLRSTLIYAAHAFPFSPGTHGGFPFKNLPLPSALQLAHNESYHGNSGRVTAVLHYYLHFSTHPVQAYRNFVQATRSTVQEYLKAHPRTRFLIRGPHVVYRGNNHHANIGDKFAHWYRRLWYQEFAGLADRAWYLDMWDFTIASENLRIHPEPKAVVLEIAKVVFGYMCDDDDDDDDDVV